MRLRFPCAILAALSPLLLAVAPPPRTDLHGDPLPPGALARLGSVRLRHAGLSDYACLADGKTVLTAGSDRTLRFWDLATGRQTRTLPLQGQTLLGHLLKLSPDGKTLVAKVAEQLMFWDVETGRQIKTLTVSKDTFSYLSFSPDGKTLAAGTDLFRMTLWDWRAGTHRELTLPRVPRGAIGYGTDRTTHATFSPDGKWLLAQVNSEEPLGVFDAASGREVYRLPWDVHASTVSPDSKTLVACCGKNDQGDRQSVLRTFDLATGKASKQIALGADTTCYSLAVSPDGRKAACGFSDDSLLLDLGTGRILHRFTERPIRMTFSRDGKTLLASAGPRLRLWDVSMGKELHNHPGLSGSNPAIAISPDGKRLAEAEWLARAVSVWDLTTGQRLRQLPLAGEKRYARSLAFSGDGKTLTACHLNGFVQSWDVATGKDRASLRLLDPDAAKNGRSFFYEFHLSTDGKTISTRDWFSAGGQSFTRLALWDATTGALLHNRQLLAEIRQVAWLAGGKVGAFWLPDGVGVVDLETGGRRVHLPDVKGSLICASPDERLLAVRLTGGSVDIREGATGGKITTIPVREVTQLALAPGSRALVTTDDTHLRVWDLATGGERLRRALPVTVRDEWGRSSVSDLALFAQGTSAFTALADGTGLVWDLAAGLRRDRSVGKSPDEKALKAWWADLASPDARRAWAATWHLADAPPASTLPFLRPQLQPIAEADARVVRNHVAALDSDDFATREKAYRALEALGQSAVPEVRRVLPKEPSLEVRRRLEKFLKGVADQPVSPNQRRDLRALHVLESLASNDARDLLTALSKGAAHAPLTGEALRALARLSRQ